MAHTDVSRTFVGRPTVTGGIWRVPRGIALPNTAYAPRPGNLVRLGGVSDEGYTYQSERTIEKKKDWNGDKVRAIQTDKDDTLQITFIEFLNPAVMAIAYGEANVTVEAATTQHGTHIAVRDVSEVLDHGAYLIDTFDGKVKRRRCIPDAQPATIEPIVEQPGDWSVYNITFDLFPDSQGATNYTYTELNDRLESLNYVLDLGGATDGDFTLSFAGETTNPLPFDINAAALKNALVGLDDGFKAADWVVTNGTGTFQIKVPEGGGALALDANGLEGGTGASLTYN